MAIEIQTRNWNHGGSDAKKFEEITRDILGGMLESRNIKRVTIYEIDGGRRTPYDDEDEFYIIMRGRAHNRSNAICMKMPFKMWGLNTLFSSGSDRNFLFEPSGDGLIIVEPESGYAVAEVIQNNLYVLCNITDRNYLSDEARWGIFRRILEETLVLLGGNFPTFEEIVSAVYKIPVRDTLCQMENEVGGLRAEVMRQMNYALHLETQLQKVLCNAASDRVIECIAYIPEVKSLTMNVGKMIIKTHTMYGEDPYGTIHEFGEFEMTLTFGADANVVFKNLTRRPYSDDRGSYGHPHVDRNGGNWCRGEGAGIVRLLENFEVEAAVLFALKAIDTVNDSTSGNYLRVLRAFPIVTRRTAYGEEPAYIDAATRENFRGLFETTLQAEKVRLRTDLDEARKAVVLGQAKIARGLIAKTVKDAKTLRGRQKVASLLQQEFEKIKKMSNIKKVSFQGNLLNLDIQGFNAVDVLQFNFLNGAVKLRSSTMPQPEEVIGEVSGVWVEKDIPLAQLNLTLAELLGSFELETAVMLCLDFLRDAYGATPVV